MRPLRTNILRLLVGVVAPLGLELLDEGDVLLLGLLRGGALVDDLLPSVLLGLALIVERESRSVSRSVSAGLAVWY